MTGRKRGSLKYGVATNDVSSRDIPKEYLETYKKIQLRWHCMLKRCYSKNYPTYADVFVCDEWLTFSNFSKWLVSNPNWQELELDKDLLVSGNRVYSPNTCVLVPHYINKSFRFRIGELTSVKLDRSSPTPKWQFTCRFDGEQVYFGRYFTKEEAVKVWRVKKSESLSIVLNRYRMDENYNNVVGNRLEEIIDGVLYGKLDN